MKIAAIIIGILGSILVFSLGVKWVGDYNEHKNTIATVQQLSKRLGNSAELAAKLKELDSTKTAGYLMIVLGLVALVASLFVAKKAKISAMVLLAAAIIPALFAPKSLIFGFILIVAGMLAYATKPKEVA